MQGALKTNAVVALFFPLIVLAVPILDTGFVVAKRLKYRRPIYQADRWHFHHRMANIGFSQRRTLAYLYGWTAGHGGARARPALRPLQRRPRPLRPALDGGDGRSAASLALAASVYLVYVLEILKLRQVRWRQVVSIRRTVGAPVPEDQEVNRAVEEELETGTFPAVDPETGEFEAIELDDATERDVSNR